MLKEKDMAKEVYEQTILKCGANLVKLHFNPFTKELKRVLINNEIVCQANPKDEYKKDVDKPKY